MIALPAHKDLPLWEWLIPRSQALGGPCSLGLTRGDFQVLGFAAFFALVLKREDDEETLPLFPGHLSSPGNRALVCGDRGLATQWSNKAE